MGIHANNRDLRLSRMYCEGAKASQDGELVTADPYDPVTEAQQSAAWVQGWNDDNGGLYDMSMCGYPKPGLPSPEVADANRY